MDIPRYRLWFDTFGKSVAGQMRRERIPIGVWVKYIDHEIDIDARIAELEAGLRAAKQDHSGNCAKVDVTDSLAKQGWYRNRSKEDCDCTCSADEHNAAIDALLVKE